jgi:hypothetical protein
LLVQLAHFGRQRLDLGVLGDVVRCLPRLIALIAQATELLNLVGILSKAGRLEVQVAAAAVDSESGELQDLLGSAPLVSGNGPSHGILYRGLHQARQRRSVGTESHGRSLCLLGMSATCGGRLGENLGDFGGGTAWAGRKIVEFLGRTYWARFAAVKASERFGGLYRRLIRRHLDF